MAIALLIALIGLLGSAGSVSANSVVSVSNSSNSVSVSSNSQTCNTDITINGQHYHNDQCNLNVSDHNGNVTTTPSAPPSPPKTPIAPTAPTINATPPAKPIPPKFPNTFPFSTQTSAVTKQLNTFFSHLQQDLNSFIHSIFDF